MADPTSPKEPSVLLMYTDIAFAIGWRTALTIGTVLTIHRLTWGFISLPNLFATSALVLLVTRVWSRYP
jgi:hypothetical protein